MSTAPLPSLPVTQSKPATCAGPNCAVSSGAAFEHIPLDHYVRKDGDFPAGKMTKRQKDQFYLELGRAVMLCHWLQDNGYFRQNCGVKAPSPNNPVSPDVVL